MSAFSGVDETRTCRKCDEPFVFTVGEQEWMAEKNFDKPPNKCKRCRKEDRDSRQSNQGGQPNQGGYNQTGGYNANPNNASPRNPSPAPLTEQKVFPTDYRDEDNNRRGRGGRRRRGGDDNNGDW